MGEREAKKKKKDLWSSYVSKTTPGEGNRIGGGGFRELLICPYEDRSELPEPVLYSTGQGKKG